MLSGTFATVSEKAALSRRVFIYKLRFSWLSSSPGDREEARVDLKRGRLLAGATGKDWMTSSVAAPAGRRTDVDASPSPAEFAALARFRQTLRRFMAFSERAAADMGMTMQWYQALLVIKTRGAERPLSVGELAEELLIKDHSAAELVSRLAEAKLVKRRIDPTDRRRSLLQMTPLADRRLAKLAALHLARLRADREAFLNLFRQA